MYALAMNNIESGVIPISGIRAWLPAITPGCISVLAFYLPVHCQTACSVSLPFACVSLCQPMRIHLYALFSYNLPHFLDYSLLNPNFLRWMSHPPPLAYCCCCRTVCKISHTPWRLVCLTLWDAAISWGSCNTYQSCNFMREFIIWRL